MEDLLLKSELVTAVCITKVDTSKEAIKYAFNYDKEFIKQHKKGNKYHVVENHYNDYFDIYRIF